MRRLLLIVSLSIVTVLGFPSTGFCEEPAGQLPAVAQDGAGDPLAKQADDEELSGRADGGDAPDAHVAENIDQEGEAPAGTISSEGGELPDEGGDDEVLIPAADELGTAQDEEAPLIECGSVCSVAASDGSGFISASGTASSSANRLSEWWESKDLGDGTYSFRSLDGGGYLGADSASKGAAVSSCASEFIWRLMGDDLSVASFAPVLNPLLRLTLLDGNALLSEDGGEGCQTFSVGLSPALAEALMAGSRDMDGLYILSSGVGSGKVLDIKAGSKNDRANAQIYSGNGSFAQSFALESAGNGLYSIRNVGSGKFLDAKGGGTANRTNVQQYSGNSTLAQLWYLIARNDFYTIKNAASGLALDVAGASSANGANVRLYTPNGSAAQDWAMRRDYPLEQAIDTGRLIPDGIYSLRSVLPGARSVDIAGASTANRANARLYAYNASFAQKYEITYVGNGFYTIQVACSGKYLDARGGKAANGTNVHQYQRNDSRAQWWYFEDTGNHSYAIKSALVGDGVYALDIAGKKNANGTNVRLYKSNDTDAQHWKVDTVPLLNNGNYVFSSFLSPVNLLGIRSASLDNKAQAQASFMMGSSEQHWKLVYKQSDDFGPYYTIQNVNSGKYLDVAGGSAANKVEIRQYTGNDSRAQKWRLSISDLGGIVLINAGSNKAVDVLGGNPRSGTKLVQYTENNTAAQSWNVYSTDSKFVKEGAWLTMNIPWAGQPNNYYCGPTAGYMVLRYLGAGSSGYGSLTIGNVAKAMMTDSYLYTSFADRRFERGIESWIGRDIYKTIAQPSYETVKQAVLRAFETGIPLVVDEGEVAGGPHFNGHGNTTFSHLMVVAGYNPTTDAVIFVDPGSTLWGGAQNKFTYPSLKQFTNIHLHYSTWAGRTGIIAPK